MNTRKFYFIVSVVLAVCLFFTGTVLLASVKMPSTDADGSESLLDKIIDPIRSENEPVNVLVLGGDKVASNTDTMILVNYNPITAKMNMMSIPRDTKVEVKGSSLPKINSAYAVGGGKEAVDTVEKLLKVNIKYYIFINTAAFREIIDTLDGVDYNVPVDMNYDDPTQDLHIHLKKGMMHMNGEKAEQFMRFRQPTSYNNEIMKYYDGSDLKRINAQQDFIKEVIRQKANIKYLSKADDIISILFKNIDTNMTASEAIKLSQNLTKLNVSEINTFTLPGESEEEGAWYYVMDKEKTQQIVSQNFTAKGGLATGKTADGKKSVSPSKNTDTPKPVVTTKPTPMATPEPQESSTPTPVPTVKPTPTGTPEIKQTPVPTQQPTHTPALTPTPTVTPVPAATPSPKPTSSPVAATPTPAATPKP